MSLKICATPIGNLKEASPRLIEVLRTVDMIAAEDTRHTRKLLTHFDIGTRMMHYSDHHEAKGLEEIIALLKEGKQVALVSDAGMPLISDPGYELVRRLLEEGLEWEVISGPSALINALVLSGLPTQPFYFEGFLPRKKMDRRRKLASLREMEATLIFYEAPTRLHAVLEDMLLIFGNRRMALCRELTKMHEEVIRLTLCEAIDKWKEEEQPRGELVLVVDGAGEKKAVGSVEDALRELLGIGFTKKEAIQLVAAERGVSKREVYRAALKLEEI